MIDFTFFFYKCKENHYIIKIIDLSFRDLFETLDKL